MVDQDCIFCGNILGGNRAKEHVVPRWLLQCLGVEKEIVIPAVARTEDWEIVDRRRHTADALLEGHVCKTCNNGWMASREGAAKPILVPLIDGKRSIFGFSNDERLVLARWAAKTAYALNSSSSLDDKVSPSHLRELQASAKSLPPGVAVFIQQHGLEDKHTRHFSWIQRNDWRYLSLVPPGDDEHRMGDGGYKVGLQFGRLILLVVYWPHPGRRFVVGAGMHVALWPWEARSFAYTINETVPMTDSYLWLAAFNQMLGVAQMEEI